MPDRYEIEEYLQQQQIPYEKKGTQFVTDCPDCGESGHTYMGMDNGVWDCKKCNAKGNYYTFRDKMFGTVVPAQKKVESISNIDGYQNRLVYHDKLKDYLFKERKLSPDVIERFKIGANEKGDISIPQIDTDGNIIGVKYRNMGDYGDKYYFEPGGKQGICNGEILKTNLESLLICEGEFDTFAALTYGIKDVIGIPGANGGKDNWIKKLEKIKEIFICFDQDENNVGQNGAYDLAARLGLDRCRNVVLPCNDLNECLINGFKVEQLKSCIESAEKFPVADVVQTEDFLGDIISKVLEPGKLKGYATGYNRLDAITKGFAAQELRILSGVSSAGKSTWITLELLRYARQNIPVALFSLESDKSLLAKVMVQNLSDTPLEQLSKEQLKEKILYLKDLPIHWLNTRNMEHDLDIKLFKQKVKEVRDRYGVKFVVLDDLDFLITSGNARKSELEIVRGLMTDLKNIANGLNIHIVVISHVNKQAQDGIPKIRDLYGSGSIFQRADYVMFIHRDVSPEAPDEIKADIKVAIAKNRPASETGVVNFRYDKNICEYREV